MHPTIVPRFRPIVRDKRLVSARDKISSMDALGTLVRSLRLTSAILSRARFRGRWGVSSNGVPGKMVFHGICAGECYVRRSSDGASAHLAAGDVVILTRGDAHTMSSDPGRDGVPIGSVPVRHGGAVPVLEYGALGPETRVVC